ncbi:MAG: TonB-dependent receptor plug domain-containing protein [Desulfococcaceae bacterium]
MLLRKSVFLSVAAFCALLAAGTVPAADTETVAALEEVVVTAARRPTSLENAPAVVEVLTAEDIETLPVRNLAEILETQAGIYTEQPQGVGVVTPQDIRLRGTFGTERVLLLLDGQPFDDPYTNYWNLSYIPVEAIQRVEIVRGPFSALYGTGALGGVISVFTKDGRGEKGVEAAAGFRAGDFGRFETVETARYADGDALSFFLSHQYFETDNYFLNETDLARDNIRDSVRNRDHDQHRFHFHARYDPSDLFRLNLSGGYYGAETGFGFSPVVADFDKGHEVDRYYANVRAEWRPRGDLDLFFGLDGLYRDRPVDADSALDQLTVVPSVNLNRDSRIRAIGGAHWSLTPNNVLSFGAEFWHVRAEQRVTGLGGEALPIFFREPQSLDAEETNFALFVQDDWAFADGIWELVLGLRYDNYGETEDAVSPKGAVIWNYRDTGRVKFSASRAFRAPSISERRSPFWNLTVQNYPFPVVPPPSQGVFAVGFLSNPDLDAEDLYSLEISLENEFLDRRLTTRLTPFWVRGEDFIATVNVPDDQAPGFFVPFPPPGETLNFSTLTHPENLDRATIQGVEAEVGYRPVPSLRLFANYLYQDAENDETGEELDFYPEHVARAGAQWNSRHFNDFLGLRAGAVVKYISDYRFTDLGGRNTGTLDGFTTADLKLKLDFWEERFYVSGEVHNLFDTQELFKNTNNVVPERNFLVGAGLQWRF